MDGKTSKEIPGWVQRKIKRQQAQARSISTYNQVKGEIRQDVWCVSIVNHFRASFGEGGRAESDRHRNKKYERWCYWRKGNFNVVVEPILKNGLRPDLIIFNDYEIFIEEIIESEGEESIERKKELYPFPLKVVKT